MDCVTARDEFEQRPTTIATATAAASFRNPFPDIAQRGIELLRHMNMPMSNFMPSFTPTFTPNFTSGFVPYVSMGYEGGDAGGKQNYTDKDQQTSTKTGPRTGVENDGGFPSRPKPKPQPEPGEGESENPSPVLKRSFYPKSKIVRQFILKRFLNQGRKQARRNAHARLREAVREMA